MKIAIVYYSVHHQNTEKLLNGIAEKHKVTLIKSTNKSIVNLSEYDLIGFASGNYYSKFHESVLQYANHYLPSGKKVFIIYTYGVQKEKCTEGIIQILNDKGADILGSYSCKGFDTFGPFKIIGGVAKGRPNENDISNGVKFIEEIKSSYY